MTEAMRRARFWLESPRTYRIFQMIAIASLALGLVVGVKQYDLTQCLANYNEATAQATQLRASASAADRQALDDMIDAIVKARALAPADAQKAVGEALAAYQTTRAYADGQRAAKPLPAPPSQTCG